MEFHFSIRAALKESWELFRKHAALFLVVTVIFLILQIMSRNKHVHYAIMAVIGIASIVWSYVYTKITLQVVDGKDVPLRLSTITNAFPGFLNFIKFLAVCVLVLAIVIGGFILLIIPSIYFFVRLCFASFSYIDRNEGIMDAIRHSWAITKGEPGWTIILAVFILGGLMLVGVFALGIGILVTYPLSYIFFTKLYRALSNRPLRAEAIVEQPIEIPPAV